MKTKKIIGYHFVGETLRDGRPIPPDGEWLVHDGPVKICESGLHYSLEPFDALEYAPGDTLCLVEIEDIVEAQKDKGVCRRRKIITRFDAAPILRYFARMQALSVIHLYPNGTDDVVLDWLMTGGDLSRSAAYSAAHSAHAAAYPAAHSAADPAHAAAYSAAHSAAYSAHAAAYSATNSAAYSAEDPAAHSAAYIEFNSLIKAELESMGAL